MLELLTKYYGIDWITILSSFLFMYYIGNKKRRGFIFGFIGSVAGLIFSIMVQSIANIIASSIFIILNIRGYLLWNKTKKSE